MDLADLVGVNGADCEAEFFFMKGNEVERNLSVKRPHTLRRRKRANHFPFWLAADLVYVRLNNKFCLFF